MIEWNADNVSALTLDKLRSLRDNAIRLGETGTIDLCNAEILKRAPVKIKKTSSTGKPSRSAGVVVGFHFVCPREREVTRNTDGTIWSGTWVVSKAHAEKAAKAEAYIALHTARSELSYLQGLIKDWRPKNRDRQYAKDETAKTREGVEFLFAPTSQPYEWVGDATGERGYLWNLPDDASKSTGD